MADSEQVFHDKRRRRRNSTETGSESEPGDARIREFEKSGSENETPDSTILDTSDEVTEDAEADNSEYESAEEEQDEVTGTEGSEEETETVDEHTYDETTDDDIDSRLDESMCSEIVEERQSGDGQEQPDELKDDLDDDEDAKNPAYIPRRGAFYEHDNRAGDEDKAETEVRPKRSLWKEEGKWLHDLYKSDLQAPKSRDELVALYGYDIRSHDRPPDEPPRFLRRGRGRRGGTESRQQLRDFMPPADEKQDDIGDFPRGGSRGGRRGRGGVKPPMPRAQDFHVKEEEFPSLATNSTPVKAHDDSGSPRTNAGTAPVPQKLRGKQYTNTTYRNTHNQVHIDASRVNHVTVEPRGPPPQAQIPVHDRRSNRAPRGRSSAERTLPERMSELTITNSSLESSLPITTPDTITARDKTPPAVEIPHFTVPPSGIPPPLQGAGDAPNLRSQKDQRPKRYSSQRQRSMQDQPPQQYPPEPVQQYYQPGFPAAPIYQPSTRDVTYPTTVFNGQAVPYPLPTGASGLASPPRLFPPPNMGAPTGPPPGLMAPPFPPGAGHVYHTPAGYTAMVGQLTLSTGMTVPPSNSQPQNVHEMYHAGTTYYPPQQPPVSSGQQWQQNPRSKKAIPIVHPQDVTSHRYAEGDYRVDDRERTPTND